jgi:molecular chaperone GrpE (heat shock protein)
MAREEASPGAATPSKPVAEKQTGSLGPELDVHEEPPHAAEATAEEAHSTAPVAPASEADRPEPHLFDDIVGPLNARLVAISSRLDELVRLGEHREDLVDRLHAENQRLRAGELAQVQAPVIRELIRTYDVVVTLAAQEGPASADLELVRRRLLDGLEQSGVRSLEPEQGIDFDAARHAAAEAVTTPDPTLDMTVERTLRVGFIQDGERILRPAEVAVRRHRQTPVPGGAESSRRDAPTAARGDENERSM